MELGSATSEEAYPIGFEFKIPISIITMCSTFSEPLWLPTTTLRAALIDLISLTQTPQKFVPGMPPHVLTQGTQVWLVALCLFFVW